MTTAGGVSATGGMSNTDVLQVYGFERLSTVEPPVSQLFAGIARSPGRYASDADAHMVEMIVTPHQEGSAFCQSRSSVPPHTRPDQGAHPMRRGIRAG